MPSGLSDKSPDPQWDPLRELRSQVAEVGEKFKRADKILGQILKWQNRRERIGQELKRLAEEGTPPDLRMRAHLEKLDNFVVRRNAKCHRIQQDARNQYSQVYARAGPYVAKYGSDEDLHFFEKLAPHTSADSEHLAELVARIQPSRSRDRGGGRRKPGSNLEVSRARVELEKKLRGELTAIALDMDKRPFASEELAGLYPGFELWKIVTPKEVWRNFLVLEGRRRRVVAYARELVCRRFNLRSAETLKKDRQKLKQTLGEAAPGTG